MKRLSISLLTGAILGIFCIIGVGIRAGYAGNELYLFSMWYNRVIMGLVVGLAQNLKIIKDVKKNVYVRGLVIGLVVSLANFLSTAFRDIPSFFAGIVYGLIIDYTASKYGK